MPDDLTADVMLKFYDLWLAQAKPDPHETLRQTQLAFRRSGDPRKADPGFWGSFVMVGW